MKPGKRRRPRFRKRNPELRLETGDDCDFGETSPGEIYVWNRENGVNCDFGLTLEDLCEEVGVVLVVEGRVSAEQDVGDHSNAPHVHGLSIRLLSEHLGRDVA